MNRIISSLLIVILTIAGFFIISNASAAPLSTQVPEVARSTYVPPWEDLTRDDCGPPYSVIVKIEHAERFAVTEEVLVSEAGWQRYSWVGGPYTADEAPAFPSESWQPNTASDPHGVGVEGAYFRSNGNSGNGDWFYLEAIDAVYETRVLRPGVEAWTEFLVIDYMDHCDEPVDIPDVVDPPEVTDPPVVLPPGVEPLPESTPTHTVTDPYVDLPAGELG